jgi:hypothetical protein
MVTDLLTKCVRNREKHEERDETVPINRCKVSKAEPNLIIATNGAAFQ